MRSTGARILVHCAAMRDRILEKLQAGERIDRQDAHDLFEQADDETLRTLSKVVRDRFHAPDEASYLIMAIVNYTNVCVAKCDYCSFYRLPGHEEGYLLSFEQVCERIDRLVGFGGTLVGFNGGFNPKLHIQSYAELFSKINARYPDIAFMEMTVAEFMYACKVSQCSYEDGARLLADSGTRWLTGGGAEVMDEAFRKRHSPGKQSVERYYDAQRAILGAGIGSTATMVIGFDETLEERLNHLEGLRTFQDDMDGGLASFLCWTYKAYGTDLGGDEIATEEYLRWLAVCRIYLDNFVHIRASVLTQNDAALRGLSYGANDFDLPTEDEVTQRAGATISHDFGRILDAARSEGFRAVHRRALPLRPTAEHAYEPSGLGRAEVLGPAERQARGRLSVVSP